MHHCIYSQFLTYCLINKFHKKKNPKLKIARLDSLISEKELSIEKSKLSPSASLNYSKSENSDVSSTIDKSNKETVKATLSWPIIKGGKNYASIKKSKHKKMKYIKNI